MFDRKELRFPPEPSAPMNVQSPFAVDVVPNWEGFLRCLRRQGTPDRVYFIELLIDEEIKAEVVGRFGLMDDVDPEGPCYAYQREARVQRFLGYDYVRYGVDDIGVKIDRLAAEDTAELN